MVPVPDDPAYAVDPLCISCLWDLFARDIYAVAHPTVPGWRSSLSPLRQSSLRTWWRPFRGAWPREPRRLSSKSGMTQILRTLTAVP